MKLFLLGARGSGTDALSRSLHQPPRSVSVRGANFLASLNRLWHATEVRVRRPGVPWVHPEPPAWVDQAVADFGRLLLMHHTQQAPVVVVAEPEAPEVPLKTWFPGAMFLHLVRDGLVAPFAMPGDPLQAARAGLAWAERWSASVAASAGHTPLRFEEIGQALPQLAVALGLPSFGVWDPRPRERMVGPAVEGFACCRAAVEAMASLGHSLPDPGPMSLEIPQLAAARARGLIDQERPGEALALLQSLDTSHPVLLDVIGSASLAGGDEDGAVAAWSEAIRHPEAPRSAWLSMLAMPERPESLATARLARASPDDGIRSAAARWMVARGMDHEAAEAIARVHGLRWYLEPS